MAGEGVSKLTTDLSGNQTVGMMAGMLASGLTSHGMDKLDVKFKQKDVYKRQFFMQKEGKRDD